MYCHVPVGWGLQQTSRAPGSDKTRGQGSFGPFTGGLPKNLKKKNGSYTGPDLLRQGEPGTSQYEHFQEKKKHQNLRDPPSTILYKVVPLLIIVFISIF